MEISPEAIANGARLYRIFAFDEGTLGEIREARECFNALVCGTHEDILKTALMQGFHRPTVGEFRTKFIEACRTHIRAKDL